MNHHKGTKGTKKYFCPFVPFVFYGEKSYSGGPEHPAPIRAGCFVLMIG